MSKDILIARNVVGEKVDGMGSRGDLEYAKGLACSYLRVARGVASIDIFRCDLSVSWLEPLTVKGVEE